MVTDRSHMTETNEAARRWAVALCFALLFALSLYVFLYEMSVMGDMLIHANLASEFDFADPHSITCRLAYPVWHICVRALQYLGLSLNLSAALTTAAFKTATMALVYRLYRAAPGGTPAWMAALAALLTLIVTGVRVSSINPSVYLGVSSPNVWHNPTQIAVTFSMLLCVPYTARCWDAFLRESRERGGQTTLPWRRIACLAAMLVFSTLCKPTFMQTLLPAAFVFFLAQWIRHPRDSRYFGQIILAFLPAALSFLVQYLYYTGVLVPFSSGVAIDFSLDQALFTLRSILMMAAFPLAAMLCCRRETLARDTTLTLALLIALFAVLEAIAFHETGLRQNDGNFTWGCGAAALLLWVVMTPKYLSVLRAWRKPADAASALTLRQKLGCALSTPLLIWHVASGIYYLYYLFANGVAH